MTGRPSGSSWHGRRPSGRPTVLLDANALFLPFTQGIDLDREVGRWQPGARLLVPDAVRRELEELEARGTRGAPLARGLAARFERCASPGRGDDALFAAAQRLGAAVVTADRALRDRLAEAGLVVLVPRDRGRLTPFQRRARRATVKNRSPLAGNRPEGGRHGSG